METSTISPLRSSEVALDTVTDTVLPASLQARHNKTAAYKELGIEARGYVCDVTSEEQVNALVAQIEKEVGVVDILVNNAGIIKRIPMCEMTAEQFRQVIDVDLNAPFIVSKAVIPSMIKKGHGKIINICSMMSELGRETVSAYAAAKGGLKMLTRNIASEAKKTAGPIRSSGVPHRAAGVLDIMNESNGWREPSGCTSRKGAV